jgi:hypothetical protein
MVQVSEHLKVGDTYKFWRLIYPCGEKAWLCQCQCLAIREIPVFKLTYQGRAPRSCGCLLDKRSRQPEAHDPDNPTRHIPEWRVWMGIKDRCFSPRHPYYQDYQGRGITMCERWRRSFVAFITDMQRRPGPKYTIDRIDNDGSYSCGACADCHAHGWTANCRWATRIENAHNKRSNHWITANGETLILTDWARRLGATPARITSRIREWGDKVRAVTEPLSSHSEAGSRGATSLRRRGRSKNISGFLGVRRNGQRWGAAIHHGHQRYWLGTYDTPEAAAHVYDAKASELLGADAVLNFPKASAAD